MVGNIGDIIGVLRVMVRERCLSEEGTGEKEIIHPEEALNSDARARKWRSPAGSTAMWSFARVSPHRGEGSNPVSHTLLQPARRPHSCRPPRNEATTRKHGDRGTHREVGRAARGQELAMRPRCAS